MVSNVNNSVNGLNLDALLQGCRKQDRQSQKLLYKQFYGYAMSVCIRYTRNYEDALEVMNDAFLKVFTKIDRYDPDRQFKSWFRKILVNCSIDKINKELKNKNHIEIEDLDIPDQQMKQEQIQTSNELIDLVQKLSPAYRSVFNLYVIDGYSHEEIGEMLGISVGTSKSNLAKARMRLRELLVKIDKDEYSRYVG